MALAVWNIAISLGLVGGLVYLALGLRALAGELAEARRAAAGEREALISIHAGERRELLTRLQAWDPNPPAPPAAGAPESQPRAGQEEPIHTFEDLSREKVRENADGGYVDLLSGAVFETLDDVREWRAALRKQGLPADLHPSIVQESGLEAALEARRSPAPPKEV